MATSRTTPWCLVLALGIMHLQALAQATAAATGGNPERGYRFLVEKAYLPPDFDQETFDHVWEVWPEPLRSQAANATLEQRRTMAMARYGLSPRPEDPLRRPLQYVVSDKGEWSMNCFACHGGRVRDTVYPGAPNVDYALQLLTAEIRQTKLIRGKRLAHMDLGSIFMPLGTTRGSTNAVMFGVALLARRDGDLHVLPKTLPPAMTHHDMDAPPWWHVRKKPMIYIDGFAPRSHRALMQFMLVEENGPEDFQAWEEDYRDVYAYIESLRPPKYPGPIDFEVARRGYDIFSNHCAECHGEYGDPAHESAAGASYPSRIVPWDLVRTDRVRLDALTTKHRARYAGSWFARPDEARVITNPGGYLAPPLDGLWATAPYLHNGSVPTLWHLLRSAQRPTLWRRTAARDWDAQRVGWIIQTAEELPASAGDVSERQEWFDTRSFGKSREGHHFPDRLNEEEKDALLEYLKTL